MKLWMTCFGIGKAMLLKCRSALWNAPKCWLNTNSACLPRRTLKPWFGNSRRKKLLLNKHEIKNHVLGFYFSSCFSVLFARHDTCDLLVRDGFVHDRARLRSITRVGSIR